LIVREAGDFARDKGLEIGAPISFPYGASPSAAKQKEAEVLIEQGATALDMVANVGWLKDGRFGDYELECSRHVRLCHDAGINAKVIIEVGYLSRDEIVSATKMVIQSGADFVKTATGTGPSGRPDFGDVRAILEALEGSGTGTRLKVSGIVAPKILNAYAFIRMGAHRIGTRAGPRIVDALPDVQSGM
jgi:deoxyribose-phosphate aldolase